MKQAGGFTGNLRVTTCDPITRGPISHTILLPGSQEPRSRFNVGWLSDEARHGIQAEVAASSISTIAAGESVSQLPQSRCCFKLSNTMTQHYIETDGKIYLVESEDGLSFPRSRGEIPFEIRQKAKMEVESEEIIYSEPVLSYHPQRWVNKEDVPLLDDVDPIVRKAVNFSLPRLVVEAVIQESNEVLLVKPSRGYNKNRWTLPGGFLVYGETPAGAVRREVEEEVGVKPGMAELLNVYSAIGAENSYQWVIFYFSAEIPGDLEELQPSHEIKQLKWFEPGEAAEVIHSPLMQDGFRQIFD